MEWLLLALAAAGGGTYTARRITARRADRRAQAEVLDQMRRLADEDVTVFGEQLQRLDHTIAGRHLDPNAQQDYQTALDAYERGKWDAPRLEHPDEISRLVDTLATGRYSLARVQARLAGQPLPELRVPCFFNPQHGPSVRDAMWTTARHGTRMVPACIRCATQLAAREKPEVLEVSIGPRRVPYWEAGASLGPYGRGYFPADATAVGATVAWIHTVPDAGSGSHGAWFHGDSGGHGFDGGGFGGGGFGGGDGGGGDGGGL